MSHKQKYAPSVFDKYVTTVTVGGKEIKLNLYDTAGKILSHTSPLLRHAWHLLQRHGAGTLTVPTGWNQTERDQETKNNLYVTY